MSFFIFFTLFLFISQHESTLILKPEHDINPAGLIFLQAASVPAANYTNYALELQAKFNGALWIALPDFPLYIPEPLLINSIMSSAYSDLISAGFNYTKSTPFFLGGQSLGGNVMQNYLLGSLNSFPFRFAGLILNGNFLSRSSIGKLAPVLTVGAELDGVCRVSRIAESFYHNQIEKDNFKNQSLTLIIKGMNHYQFYGQGGMPAYISKNDIKSEVNDSQARDLLTTINSAFMHLNLNVESDKDRQILSDYYKSTQKLVSPILDGFAKEGFYHFYPPCYQNKSPNCTNGSQWSLTAQEYMSSIDSTHLNISDLFVQILSVPERFPTISNCSGDPCLINIGTVTENTYSSYDALDSGFYPVAAMEAKTKMNSRQSVLQRFTGNSYDFNQTDAKDLCKEINEMSIEWAIQTIQKKSSHTVNRYREYGKQLVGGADIGPVGTGVQWLATSLSFTEKTIENRTYVELRSPTLRTPTNYPVSFVAGYHYCKLITPGRAVEWIYIDSLKP